MRAVLSALAFIRPAHFSAINALRDLEYDTHNQIKSDSMYS
jgi:hypothetical protein